MCRAFLRSSGSRARKRECVIGESNISFVFERELMDVPSFPEVERSSGEAKRVRDRTEQSFFIYESNTKKKSELIGERVDGYVELFRGRAELGRGKASA